MDGLLEIFNESGQDYLYDAMRGVYDEYTSETKKYEAALINANALGNRIVRDCELNCKQAKIRCIQESGTEDDYNFFVESASMAASQKLRSVIEKIIAFWKELVAKITHIIQTKVCTAEAKMYVKKIEKEIAVNPALGKMKVQVVDNAKYIGLLEKTRKKLDTYDAILVAGFTGKVKMGTFGTTIEDVVSAVGNIPVATVVMTTMTVSALVTSIMLDMDKLPIMIKELDERSSTILKRFTSVVDDEIGAAAIGAFQQAANFRVQLNKQECDTRIQWLIDKIGSLKEALRNAQGVGTVNMNVTEDAENDVVSDMTSFLENSDEIFMEGLNKDLRLKYRENCAEIKTHIANARKAFLTSDINTINRELIMAEQAVDRSVNELKEMGKYDIGSNIVGVMVEVFIDLGRYMFHSFGYNVGQMLAGNGLRTKFSSTFSGKLDIVLSIIQEVIVNLTAIGKDIASGKFNIGSMNMYRNRLIVNIQQYKHAIKKAKLDMIALAKITGQSITEESVDEDAFTTVTEESDDLDGFLTRLIESSI